MVFCLLAISWNWRLSRLCFPCLQVVAGELELNHECSLMHWSPEDFESKLQVLLWNQIAFTNYIVCLLRIVNGFLVWYHLCCMNALIYTSYSNWIELILPLFLKRIIQFTWTRLCLICAKEYIMDCIVYICSCICGFLFLVLG